MSNGIGKNPLIDISKVYVQQVVEKKKDDTYLEPDMKKRQANNEKARKDMEKMGTSMKNPHFESVEKSGWDAIKACSDGYEAVYKEVEQVDEADTRPENINSPAHKDRSNEGLSDRQIRMKKFAQKRAQMALKKEALDPVGKEDGDVNNDGKKDSSDKYLMKRRAAIGKAMASTKKKMTEGVRDLDPEKGTEERKARLEKKRGMKLDDHPQFKKEEVDPEKSKKIRKKLPHMGTGNPHYDAKSAGSSRVKDFKFTPVKEAYSSWRNDLSEVMTDDVSDKPIKEKKVSNTIKINPKLGEAIEAMGGELIEATEVDEAVYGGTPKEEPKDTRMTVTNADKRGNTPAYQRFKAGDKRYKAADHMKEEAAMSDKEIRLQKQKARIDQMIAQRRKQDLSKKSEAPTKVMGEGKGDPCWDTHKQVGMKKKGGRMVPNCVPKESTEDSLRDRRMERGGVDGNTRYDKAPKFAPGPSKKKYDGMSAVDIVKAEIRKKHGKGAIIDTKKK